MDHGYDTERGAVSVSNQSPLSSLHVLRAKYPLAMVAKMMEVLGNRILVGYDIGCTFGVTIAQSSLGNDFARKGYRACVNTFHGYAHNYHCQQHHHPNIIPGAGLEDLEGMERIFSASNWLARVIRYASAYRRRLWITLHFGQWDEDKYLNLGQMLYDNYRQALQIIDTEGLALEHALSSLNLTKADLDAYARDEIEYVQTLRSHTRFDERAVVYVRRLQCLKAAEWVFLCTYVCR